MVNRSLVPPEFKIEIDDSKCIICGTCVRECPFEVFKIIGERIEINERNCVGCMRCTYMCPTGALWVSRIEGYGKPHGTWTYRIRRDIWRMAETGSAILSGTGTDLEHPNILDRILIDACQVTRPPIDPLREPIELKTFIGRRPPLEIITESRINTELELETITEAFLELEIPVMFAAMSYGALSLETHKTLARAAKILGTYMNCGEGGVHEEIKKYKDNIIVQVASGRFGVSKEYLENAAAVEIKIGQGAKPGIGGHLPGEKVNEEISKTRMIPVGTDALSPAPHHDIYSIEDLTMLVTAIKEATDYRKPVFVKIAAVHDVAAIASGIARSGADAIVIDSFKGGTAASPKIVKDNVGIPVELAIPAVDDRLREEGIREEVSLIASGGIRTSADVMKIIALGADAAYIGTAALIAMGCHMCQACHTGKCPWGIATQDPELRKRLDIDAAVERVVNLLNAWKIEMKEILGALGMDSIEGLRSNRERLRGFGLDEVTLNVLGIKPAGR